MAIESKAQTTRRRLTFGLVVFASLLIATTLAYGITPQEEIQPTRDLVADTEDKNRNDKNRPVEQMSRGDVSSDKCRQCHAHHHDTWHASHHRTMTQVPTKESVVADFDNKVFNRSGREFRFFHKDDQYFMEMKDIRPKSKGTSSPSQTFKIVLMTGAHHQQGFWCETDQGRTLRNIPFIWVNKEERWVPYGSIFLTPPTGLSMHAGTWNSNCIKCHVVGGQPRLDPKTGFDTHVAEFGISCEACHGPGEAHVAFHEDLKNNGQHEPLGKQKLVNPIDLSHKLSSQTCGQCHSVFDFYDAKGKNNFIAKEGFSFRPGDDLLESRHVFRLGHDEELPIVKQKLKDNPKFWEQQFWSDGMVRVSGREYNGLLETPCYQRGKMSCLSCHDMHPSELDDRPAHQWADDQMKPTMRGNSACLQCHEEYKSDERLAKHTHHSAESSGSNCYNCHMPHTTLGLMKAMRSHTIDSPNVATTVATGRPNACNLCHLDRSLAWTSKHLEDWYKIAPPKLSKQEREVASSVRWILKGDAGQRAIVGWHFGWAEAKQTSGTQWMAPYLAELMTDNYEVVRFIGYHSLKELPDFADFEYDYVGSKQNQKLDRIEVLQRWIDSDTKPSPSKALLISDQNTLLEDVIQKIRNQRLDPPMTLIE